MTTRALDNTFKAGMFVVTAIVLFIFSIYFLGSEREIFSSQKQFYTAFKDVKGLSEGAPVRLGGISIGKVEKIQFGEPSPDAPEGALIQVTLGISEKYLNRIRLDSKVGLETQGLLGDKFISMSTGKDPHVVPPGSMLQVTSEGDITEIMSKAGKFADNTLQISEDVKSLAAEFRSDGTLGQGLKEATAFFKSLNEMSNEVKHGTGLFHAMIYDKDGGKVIRSFSELSENLSATSKEITQIVTDIRSGNGMLHDLVYNKSEEGLADVVKRLNDTAENLRLASEALKSGTGTLGALLVDAKLYDNLVEVTDGAKRSFILRQAVRSSLNK